MIRKLLAITYYIFLLTYPTFLILYFTIFSLIVLIVAGISGLIEFYQAKEWRYEKYKEARDDTKRELKRLFK